MSAGTSGEARAPRASDGMPREDTLRLSKDAMPRQHVIMLRCLLVVLLCASYEQQAFYVA